MKSAISTTTGSGPIASAAAVLTSPGAAGNTRVAEATDSFVDVCDCRVFVRRGGAGQPLLFLHGARGLPGWLPFLAKLADRFDVIAPDHPGYGRSETPAWLEEIPDLAQFYLEFLKTLNLTKVHVVGHSMGGWIALEIATRSVERFATLTVISSGGLRIKGFPSPDVFAMDREEALPLFFHDPATIERALKHVMSPEEELQVARLLRISRAASVRCFARSSSVREITW